MQTVLSGSSLQNFSHASLKTQSSRCAPVKLQLPGLAQNVVLKHLRSEFDMEGFRKGKAKKLPDSVLLATFGPKRVKTAVVEQLLNTVTPLAATGYKDTAIADSISIVDNVDELAARLDVTNDFKFTFGFDIAPQLGWKKPYKNMRVEVVPAGDEASDAQALEAKLLSARKEKGTLSVVIDRGLQRGDVAVVDFVAKRMDLDEELMGSRRTGMQMDTDTADYAFMPGIVEGMVGMRPGEERDVRITIPDNWEPATLQGLEVECHVKLNEVFKWQLPEMTDEWAREMDPSSSGFEELSQKLLNLQKAETAAATTRRIYDALNEAVAQAVDVEVPESLIQEVGKQDYQAKLLEMQAKGKLTLEQVSQLATEELLNNYISQKRESLVEIQKTTLAMEAIFQAEKLQIAQADVDAEFALASADMEEQGAEYDKERLLEQVTETLKGQKTLEWLEQNNEVILLAPQPSI
ncbi:hypothetical protein WJX72_000020 [[Myrmecia] bisecta]|uniref:peptidylprolyl isomerase n=1 Tax=[Myrmecia] bisecta TaxID=41462 RepID=A0AAW1Q357_9CHLO